MLCDAKLGYSVVALATATDSKYEAGSLLDEGLAESPSIAD